MKGNKKGGKSFSQGLESAFLHRLFEDNQKDNPSMFINVPEIEEEAKQEKPTAKKRTTKRKKSTDKKPKKSYRKSFADNLESFFKDSVESVLDGAEVTEIKRRSVKSPNKRKAIGIDMLIQRTINKPEKPQPRAKPNTKRVTFVLEEEQISSFKQIARSKKKHMRSIVAELLEDYIEENQKKKKS